MDLKNHPCHNNIIICVYLFCQVSTAIVVSLWVEIGADILWAQWLPWDSWEMLYGSRETEKREGNFSSTASWHRFRYWEGKYSNIIILLVGVSIGWWSCFLKSPMHVQKYKNSAMLPPMILNFIVNNYIQFCSKISVSNVTWSWVGILCLPVIGTWRHRPMNGHPRIDCFSIGSVHLILWE